MRLARRALVIALTTMTLCAAVSAQTLRSEGDPRNVAPTVGTGAGPGGPTGLFTVYDGSTLRRGEFTISFAYSNFDRDPGNVDITQVPVSVQVGLSDYLEVFANSDWYKGVKVNSPRHLSGFYLPNSRFYNTGKIVLSPIATGPFPTNTGNPVFSGPGIQPIVAFPFVGGSAGNFGAPGTTFALGANAGSSSGNFGGAGNFPGIGSTYGSILPGIVLATGTRAATPTQAAQTIPTSSTIAPAYLPDMPFLNRIYGVSSFNTIDFGAKIRFTSPDSGVGFGVIPFYRYYLDKADDASGFNQLQRGASAGASFGDIGAIMFLDGRLANSVNLSVNAGYVLTGNPKSETFGGSDISLIDRPDELQTAIGFDFPINKYFQPIAEFRTTQYIGGRTPNALENSPIDILGGVRIFPRRWMGISLAYRRHMNQQSSGSFSSALPTGFLASDDPNGFIGQFFIGHRNERAPEFLPNQPPTATLSSSGTTATVCPRDTSLAKTQVQLTTQASDPDGDTLLYTYNVTGGTVSGEGANVTWDLAGVQPGTYNATVEVNDGCGCVTFSTTTVTVDQCPEPTPTPVPCPTVSIDCPTDVVTAGNPVTFTANISGGDSGATLGYNWTVSAGTITSGQGTTSITVDSTGVQGSIVATANITGLPAECTTNSASCTVTIGAPPVATEFIEFPFVSFDDAKANLDNFAVDLQGRPAGTTGTIIVYAAPRDRRGEALRIGNRLKGYLVRNRQIEDARITVVDGGLREQRTVELFTVPPSVAQPTAEPTPGLEAAPRAAPRRRRRR